MVVYTNKTPVVTATRWAERKSMCCLWLQVLQSTNWYASGKRLRGVLVAKQRV